MHYVAKILVEVLEVGVIGVGVEAPLIEPEEGNNSKAIIIGLEKPLNYIINLDFN